MADKDLSTYSRQLDDKHQPGANIYQNLLSKIYKHLKFNNKNLNNLIKK